MRTRVTQGPLMTDYTHVYSVDTVAEPDRVSDYGSFPCYYRPGYECIVDDPKVSYIEVRPGVRRRLMKPVFHEKYSVTWQNTQVVAQQAPFGYWAGSAGAKIYQLQHPDDLGQYAYALALSLLPESAVTGHYDRWQAIKPTMKSRANLTVSLLELRDIKRMWDLLPNKHFTLGDWRTVLQYANGLHLNYNFGWKPFLRDISSVLKALDAWDHRLNRLMREVDIPLCKSFKESPVEKIVNSTYSLPEGGFRVRYDLKATLQISSTFQYSYYLPYHDFDSLRWRAWLDTLGLNPSIANLWRVMPWSFVVDWFYNVSGLLDSVAEADWVQPWIYFNQACYSRKVTGTLDMSMEWLWNSVATSFPLLSLTFSQYRRQVGLPSFDASTESLDADKIRLGASLLYGVLGPKGR